MEKITILDKIKVMIAAIAWELFIWGSGFTEEEYWTRIYEQEKERVYLEQREKAIIKQRENNEQVNINRNSDRHGIDMW